jgi:RHS repeat-associated protein
MVKVKSATNTVSYTYDAIGGLKTALGKEAGGTSRFNEQFGYVYDAAGNLNRRTNHTFIQSFNVNNLNQLTTVTQSGKYTVAGCLTTLATNVTVNTTNALRYADATFAATNFTLVNGTNTFTAIAKDIAGRVDTNVVRTVLLATNTYVYDQNGNLRTNGARIYEYDDENQLVRVTQTNAWKAEFTYDGKFRRRIQRDYVWLSAIGNWQLTNEVRFVYDGNVVIQHRDSNNVPALTLTRGLDLGGGLQGAGGIGGLLAMTESSGNSSYYHADGNGNVTALASGSGVVVARYLYDPFGNTLAMSGPKALINTYRFSGKPIHDGLGWYDYLRRWYAPEMQRWPNRDPIGEEGGINLYNYVGNSPVSWVDVWGLDAIVIVTSGSFLGIFDHTDIYVPTPDGQGWLVGSARFGKVDPPFIRSWIPPEDSPWKKYQVKCDSAADVRMYEYMKTRQTGQWYPYCVRYCAEVLDKGMPNNFNRFTALTASGLIRQINSAERSGANGLGGPPPSGVINVNSPPTSITN